MTSKPEVYKCKAYGSVHPCLTPLWEMVSSGLTTRILGGSTGCGHRLPVA